MLSNVIDGVHCSKGNRKLYRRLVEEGRIVVMPSTPSCLAHPVFMHKRPSAQRPTDMFVSPHAHRCELLNWYSSLLIMLFVSVLEAVCTYVLIHVGTLGEWWGYWHNHILCLPHVHWTSAGSQAEKSLCQYLLPKRFLTGDTQESSQRLSTCKVCILLRRQCPPPTQVIISNMKSTEEKQWLTFGRGIIFLSKGSSLSYATLWRWLPALRDKPVKQKDIWPLQGITITPSTIMCRSFWLNVM